MIVLKGPKEGRLTNPFQRLGPNRLDEVRAAISDRSDQHGYLATNVPRNESRGRPEPSNSDGRESISNVAATIGRRVNDYHPVKGLEWHRKGEEPPGSLQATASGDPGRAIHRRISAAPSYMGVSVKSAFACCSLEISASIARTMSFVFMNPPSRA